MDDSKILKLNYEKTPCKNLGKPFKEATDKIVNYYPAFLQQA